MTAVLKRQCLTALAQHDHGVADEVSKLLESMTEDASHADLKLVGIKIGTERKGGRASDANRPIAKGAKKDKPHFLFECACHGRFGVPVPDENPVQVIAGDWFWEGKDKRPFHDAMRQHGRTTGHEQYEATLPSTTAAPPAGPLALPPATTGALTTQLVAAGPLALQPTTDGTQSATSDTTLANVSSAEAEINRAFSSFHPANLEMCLKVRPAFLMRDAVTPS